MIRWYPANDKAPSSAEFWNIIFSKGKGGEWLGMDTLQNFTMTIAGPYVTSKEGVYDTVAISDTIEIARKQT